MDTNLDTIWPSRDAPLPPISDEEFAEFEYLLKLEQQWKDSQKKYSFRELMQIFPEAIGAARRGQKVHLKIYKQKLRDVDTQQESYYDNVILQYPWQEREALKEESDKDFEETRKKWTSKIKTVMFNLSHLDELEGKITPKKTGGATEQEIAQAKEISITNFYGDKLQIHGKLATGRCPFHNEKTGSFTIYLDQNTWWCYGCQAGGTVVDFLMKQQNIDFLTAIKQLIKK